MLTGIQLVEQDVTGHSKPTTFHRYVTSEVSSVLGQDIGDKISFCYQIFEANAIRISGNDNKSLSLADKNVIISRLARHPNAHFHYSPTHASWLNQRPSKNKSRPSRSAF